MYTLKGKQKLGKKLVLKSFFWNICVYSGSRTHKCRYVYTKNCNYVAYIIEVR